MCLMVYIASDTPLSLIAWDENYPVFYVAELSHPNDEQVRSQFSKSHIYYVGANEGCGCGFSYGRYPELENDAETRDRNRESVMRFSQYLAEAVAKHGTIELFACWDGDQSAPPEHHGSITPDDIGGEKFWFEEKQFLIVGSKNTPSK